MNVSLADGVSKFEQIIHQLLGIPALANHVDVVVACVKEDDRPRLNRSNQTSFVIVRAGTTGEFTQDCILIMRNIGTMEYSYAFAAIEQRYDSVRGRQMEDMVWALDFAIYSHQSDARCVGNKPCDLNHLLLQGTRRTADVHRPQLSVICDLVGSADHTVERERAGDVLHAFS